MPRVIVRQGKARAEIESSLSVNLGECIAQALGISTARAVGVNAYVPDQATDESPSGLVMRFDVFYDRGQDGSASDFCELAIYRDDGIRPVAD